VFREGTALEALESVDSRRFLPQALAATLLTIVAPAVLVVALSPLSGILDLLLSALLATGLSVAAGTACAALWTRLPQSREIPFGDLMLWSWARRVRAERRLAHAVAQPAGDSAKQLAALRTLAVVFEARQGSSHGHSGRVARHAQRIARRLGLPDGEVEQIEAAAAVHDIGMLGIPGTVLAKSDAERTPDERALVRSHVEKGAARVAEAAGPAVADLVRHHHERVDGGGYPDGLSGDGIPLGARIIAVADRFDELVSPAPGQRPTGRRNALDELSARAGSELDAEVVAAFVAYYSGVRGIAGVAFAATAPQRAVRWIAAAPATIGSAAGGSVALQGLCAAGATVIAGACLSGLPALAPERGGGGSASERAGQAADGDRDGPSAATSVAAAPDAGTRGGDRAERRRGGDGGLGDGAPPQSGAPQPPAAEGGPGGGSAPTAPGGGRSPAPGTGGAGLPSTEAPSTPPVDVELPQVEAPQLPASPVSEAVDPVLDGLSEALPPVKPVTDTVKGVVGGLTGGLSGGGR
jgi:HD-GYP domain-containing protein (c-di-GMP phosphodiesterase class II)